MSETIKPQHTNTRKNKMKTLSKTEIAIANSKTVFGSTVKDVASGLGKTERVIKKSTNIKLGKKVTKGWLKGFPIFTVTLEERATCPRSCAHWNDCYGNNMPFATRYQANDVMIETMEKELHELQKKHPKGFLVRLHVLGDFYSVGYVAQWAKWLTMFPALHVYGYTANQPNAIDAKEKAIGQAIQSIRDNSNGRFAVRFSGNFEQAFSANSFDNEKAKEQVNQKQAFICPVQTDKVSSCGACGLCWQSQKTVVFITH